MKGSTVKQTNEATRQRILDFILLQGPNGATCDEVEAALGLPHQTASARICELHRKLKIKDCLRKRRTRAGGKAGVWVGMDVIMPLGDMGDL